MLSLEIIGCSGAVPEAGGACSCYLVRGGGATLLLDCGPGALPRLATRVAPEAVDAIFLSHMHQDHILDLLPYTRVLRAAGALQAGEPRYAPRDADDTRVGDVQRRDQHQQRFRLNHPER